MATLHPLPQVPPSERGALVKQAQVGASPLLLVCVLLLVAALMWVLR